MMGQTARSGGRVRLAALMVGMALLMGAWIAATVPFSGPDEAAHYLRAVAITKGQLLGPKVRYTGAPLDPLQEAWANRDTTATMIPAPLTPPNVLCMTGKPDARGACFEENFAGNYQPLSYFLPAAAVAVSSHTSTALWLGRAADALQCLAFLLLAIALLWNGDGWSVLGLLAAVTPMVFFSSSIINPSGLQATSSLALVAAILRIVRDPVAAPRWTWAAFAVSGAAAILSGPIGLEFVIIVLAVFGVLLGPHGLRQLRGIAGRPVVVLAALTLVTAAVLFLVYSSVAGFGAPTFRISPLGQGLHQGIAVLPSVLQGGVGIFALLTIFLPLALYWVWWLLVLGLVGGALALGDRRRALVTFVVTIAALAFPVLFYAWIDRFTGFPLQGREVLPILMLIPLVAGEVVSSRSSGFAQRWFAQLTLGGVIALIAVFQAYAWWHAAHAAAGGTGIWFLGNTSWSPPAGWLPWALSAALGTVALLAFAASLAFPGVRLAMARGPARRDQVAA